MGENSSRVAPSMLLGKATHLLLLQCALSKVFLQERSNTESIPTLQGFGAIWLGEVAKGVSLT